MKQRVAITLAVVFVVIQLNFLYFYRYSNSAYNNNIQKRLQDVERKLKVISHKLSRPRLNLPTNNDEYASYRQRRATRFSDAFGPLQQAIQDLNNDKSRSKSSDEQNLDDAAQIPTETDSNRKLLLSSHRTLAWYYPDYDEYKVLNQDNGIYYGFFPDVRLNHLYVVSSALNLSKTNKNADSLMEVSMNNGREFNRFRIASKFTHDAVLTVDGKKALVADTSSGSILVLSSTQLKLEKRLSLFSGMNHINTFAPTEKGTVWIILHNLGISDMVEVDYTSGEIICMVREVGKMAHGLVRFDEENAYLLLSSRECKLFKIIIPENCRKEGVSPERELIWELEDGNMSNQFAKGLAVLDNVAYFGLSRYERSRKARMDSVTRLVAVDLKSRKQLWTRTNIGVQGLLNIIGTPHLGISSTYRMMNSSPKRRELQKPYFDKNALRCAKKYVSLLEESKSNGPAFGTTGSDIAFIRLPLSFDVVELLHELDALSRRVGWTLRPDVNNYFILLVTKKGNPNDQSNEGPFHPVPDRLSEMPYTRKVFDSFKSVIGRSRYMKLNAKTNLKPHRDRVFHVRNGRAVPYAGYWGRRFRVHIPLRSHESVKFGGEGILMRTSIRIIIVSIRGANIQVHMKEGYAYLFDNSHKHYVSNPSNEDRIHLIFDTVGSVPLYDLILNSTAIRADGRSYSYATGEEGESPVKIEIPKRSSSDVDLLYERWADENVFEPMKPNDLRDFLIHYIIPLVDRRSARYEEVEELFSTFIAAWEAECSRPIQKMLLNELSMKKTFREAQQHCKHLALDFLMATLGLDECSEEKRIPLHVLGKKTSLSLSNVVEIITRMAFYECKGWDMYNKYGVEGPPCFSSRF